MIKFNIDGSGKYEVPELILCNPNRKSIGVLEHHNALTYIPKLHGLSTLTFTMNSHLQNGKANPIYEYIVKNRLISICSDYEDEESPVEWFIIHTADIEYHNDTISTKTVSCYSYERSLGRRNADFLDGTYKLYDYTSPSGTILQKVIEVVPQWSIGTVEASLLNRWRTFEGIEDTLYDFLIGDCEEAFDCILVFDNDALTISAYDRTTFIKRSNVVLSHSNLIKALSISDGVDDVVTALSVVGGGDVDIRSVNPVGDNYIYDYSYFKTIEWIDQGLIDAINKWESVVESNRSAYSNNLQTLKTYKAQLLSFETQLVDLQNELNAIDLVRSQQMSTANGVQKATTDQYNAKLTQVNNKKKEITSKKSQISSINTTLNNISNRCKKSANFTTSQLKQLDEITFQGEYSNPNYITTASMTEAEKQTVYEELFDRGKKEMKFLSVPSSSFEIESMNLFFIERFKKFANELRLGCSVNVEMQEDLWAYPVLLELEIHFDNPTDFRMVFGTKLNMQSTLADITEALKDAQNTNTKVSSNASTWDIPVKSGFVDEVTGYMNNTLDLAHQQIMNTSSQTIELADWGIQIRKLLSNGTYDPRQTRITNGVIAMTDDNWQTSKLAIGVINGVSSVNANVVAGTLLAGNMLTITNEKGSFKLDGDKITVLNMDMTLTRGTNKIALNTTAGLLLSKNGTTMFDLNLSTGNAYFNGNGTFNGTVVANAGSLGGWSINANGIYNNATGDSIMSNGTGKLSLLSWGTNWARFTGEIQATSGRVGGFNIINGVLYSDAADSRGAIINIRTNGTGRIGLMNFGLDWASFDGNIYAKNLIDKVTANNMGDQSIASNAYQVNSIPYAAYSPGSIGASKLLGGYNAGYGDSVTAFFDTIYAKKVVADEVEALRARINDLLAGNIQATKIRTNTLEAINLQGFNSSGGLDNLTYGHTVRTTDNRTIRVFGASV